MKRVVRTRTYQSDLEAIESYIAADSPRAGTEMWFHIDDQVEQLTDPERCLRVGLASGDLRNHPVDHFVEGILAAMASAPLAGLNLLPIPPISALTR